MSKPRETAIICLVLCLPVIPLILICLYYAMLTIANFGGAGECERYKKWIFWNFWGNLANIIYSNTIFYICGIFLIIIPADWHRVDNGREVSKAERARNIIFLTAQMFLIPVWLFYIFITIWAMIIIRFTNSGCSDTF